MKKYIVNLCLLFFVSCSVNKELFKEPTIEILNNNIDVNGGILHIKFTNDSKNNLFLLINENPNYYKNFIFINYKKLTSTIKLIIVDDKEEDVGYIIGGNTMHDQDLSRDENEIIKNKYNQPQIRKINSKGEYILSVPFYTKYEENFSNFYYEYSFEKNKTYYLKVHYEVEPIIRDSLNKKDIYKKLIYSNKIQILQ
jgi:hypothetical protein